MPKAIIDTNVYVDWFNEGLHADVIFQRGTIRYLSAVVPMELATGAKSPKDRRLLRTVSWSFRRAGRIVAPGAAVFEEAGSVLRALRSRLGYDSRGASSLSHDVLIALSARSIGATVVTHNAADFEAIRSVRTFSLVILS